jgi:hypothetical protein
MGSVSLALWREPRQFEAGFRELIHANQSLRNWPLRAGEATGRR